MTSEYCTLKKLKGKPQTLTYEEHKKISDFLRSFNTEGPEVFDLLKKCFTKKGDPVKWMAKAIDNINFCMMPCENRSYTDRPKPMDYESKEYTDWRVLYLDIGSWHTVGFYK